MAGPGPNCLPRPNASMPLLALVLLSALLAGCAAQEDLSYRPKQDGACCVETHGEITVGTEVQTGKGRGPHY